MTLLVKWFHPRRGAQTPGGSAELEPVAVAAAVPPTGIGYALYNDPLTEPEPIAGSAFKTIVDTGDGQVHLQTASGGFLSQNPLQRGSFSVAPEAKQYETFGREGNLITSWTRPAEGDPIYTYVLVRIPNAG